MYCEGLLAVCGCQSTGGKGWAPLWQSLETIETNMIKHTQSRGRGAGDSLQTSFTCAEQVLVSEVCEVRQVFSYICEHSSLIQVLGGICHRSTANVTD